MLKVEQIRHQAAIAGRVIDKETGQAIAGALVTLTAAPPVFMAWLALRKDVQFGAAAWEAMIERPDRKISAADGHFHFLDLPADQDHPYTVTATLPGAGTRYSDAAVEVKVLRDEASGRITLAPADLALLPTGVAGLVTNSADNTPVILAEVRVQGSDEYIFTKQTGRYSLTGLEAGQRTLLITAPSYLPETKTVQLTQGAILPLNIILTKR